MPYKCSDIGEQTAKAGDRYYKAVGEWIRGRMRSPVLREQARRLAAVYRRSLEQAVECYRHIRRSPAARGELEYAVELQTLLKKDIEILGPSTGELKPPVSRVENP